MTTKRILGALFTILLIAGFTYLSILFVNSGGTERATNVLITYGVVGALLFISDIGLRYARNLELKSL